MMLRYSIKSWKYLNLFQYNDNNKSIKKSPKGLTKDDKFAKTESNKQMNQWVAPARNEFDLHLGDMLRDTDFLSFTK